MVDHNMRDELSLGNDRQFLMVHCFIGERLFIYQAQGHTYIICLFIEAGMNPCLRNSIVLFFVFQIKQNNSIFRILMTIGLQENQKREKWMKYFFPSFRLLFHFFLYRPPTTPHRPPFHYFSPIAPQTAVIAPWGAISPTLKITDLY